jgi:type II secretion system protein J
LRRDGFTLVELLVASTIGVFIAFVAVAALRTISASVEMVDGSVSSAAVVRFASGMVARDLTNLYRDKDMKGMKFVGSVEGSGSRMSSYLTLYTVGRVKARIDQPEGDVYEVEYYLSRKGERSALMRRLWPNPDKEAKAGGMLTPIAEDIDVFQVTFFDGKRWHSEWPETFIVNFARSAWERGDGGSEKEESEGQ